MSNPEKEEQPTPLSLIPNMAQPGRFAVSTDLLRHAQYHLDHLGNALSNAFGSLQSKLLAFGPCWGDDPIGQQFAKEYLKSKAEILQGVEDMAKTLHSGSQGVATMKTGLDRLEQSTVDELSKSLGRNPVDTAPTAPAQRGGKR